MRDLDKLLADRGNPEPRRPLRADFTQKITEHIKTHPRPAGMLARIKEKLAMKLHKPATAFAAAAITLIVGGTAYAAFNWPTITSVFRSETRLSNGNRVVGVDTENCQYFGKPDPKSTNKETMYYEIKKESKLSNDQIVGMIKGICEENWHNEVVNNLIQQFLKDGRNIMSGQASVVKGIGDGHITLAGDPQYDSTMRYTDEITYNLTAGTKAYDGTTPIKLSDIKAGDTIVLIVDDKRTVGSEGDPQDPNHWDDPEHLTVLALIKVQPLSGSPDTFYKHLGTDFVRTEPCDTDPSGFCRAYDFVK